MAKADQAKFIRLAERDSKLELNESVWPRAGQGLPGWDRTDATQARDGYFSRTIDFGAPLDIPSKSKRFRESTRYLWEAIARLPTAPIYGINKIRERPYDVKTLNFHSIRLIGLGESPPTRVRKIYVFNNGLNELEHVEFYYKFCRSLLASTPDALCLIKPFPGHLWRFPIHAAYAKRPLDVYLEDSGDLFRQFLRNMVETRWLLSAIAPRASYSVAAGAMLLASSSAPEDSRLSARKLTSAITEEFSSVQTASRSQRKIPNGATASAEVDVGPPVDRQALGRAVRSLRRFLRQRVEPGKGPERPPNGEPEALEVHVIGYSLGGFVAQSIFMTWPFIVSSCSTICSGGALREMSPMSFAHPEEWQTVMNMLRYQLDDAMLDERISRQGDVTAGLDSHLFAYLSRVFYEVFEQENRGSYQTHVSEYARRLLFVVGGNDPIVRPKTVLDSAPTDGINLLSIAGLSHFLGGRPASTMEKEQRNYWIPEVAGMIARFATEAGKTHAVDLHTGWLDANLERALYPHMSEPDDPASLRSATFTRPPDGALASPQFEQYMDLLCHNLATEDGWLFILRNDLPTALLPQRVVRWRASSLHSADPPIVRYMAGVDRRHGALATNSNVAFVLSQNAGSKFVSESANFPANSAALCGQLPTKIDLLEAWREFSTTWLGKSSKVRFLPLGVIDPSRPSWTSMGNVLLEKQNAEKGPIVIDKLPELWMWASEKWLGVSRTGNLDAAVTQLIGRYALPSITKVKKDREALALKFEGALRDGTLQMLTISGAKFNPRYRGKLVMSGSEAQSLIIHAAIALAASVVDPAPLS